ncbi:hypothetical protein ABZ848_24165 [Streptomyces sp. NPDC047081]|uniref:hypothetical protein n=1 Tax=Streptomyces sp. NPDC047081 TaxID=3154706 RepID=UPI0033D50F55
MASIVVAALGGAAVALRITFNRRNQTGNGPITIVTSKGTGITAAGRDVIHGPDPSAGPGQQGGTN